MTPEQRRSAFWELASGYMSDPDVEEGTLMGNRCLRAAGEFLATVHRRSGDIIVKLDANRVDELVEQGVGEHFAPAGRTFTEWVAIPGADVELWDELIAEALRLNRSRGEPDDGSHR